MNMTIAKTANAQNLVKAFIGWIGLGYFFFTSHVDWGEAIGLTLFFASGQLQTAVKPPINGITFDLFAPEDLLEAWRITIGVATFAYYFYFVLYLGRSVSVYVSTVCLSLLWESQIIDDVINLIISRVSYDMVNSTMFVTKRLMSLKQTAIKAFARNIVQDFLCVLCKLYKHLYMNCININYFLLSQVTYITGAALSIVKRKSASVDDQSHYISKRNHMSKRVLQDSKQAVYGCKVQYSPTVQQSMPFQSGNNNQEYSAKMKHRGGTSPVF